MKRTAFITGVTSGIELATARILAKNRFKLIVCGRRRERLIQLQNELQPITEVQTLNFDVLDKDEVAQLVEGCLIIGRA